MGYAIYQRNGRDMGYGVPAWCDYPDCWKKIDRGLGYLCGTEPGQDDDAGCGLYFCDEHCCIRFCMHDSFEPKPDHPEWVLFKLTDESWGPWRDENPDWVKDVIIERAKRRLVCGDGCHGCLGCWSMDSDVSTDAVADSEPSMCAGGCGRMVTAAYCQYCEITNV